MERFYGDIENNKPEYLLKATPYIKESRINFDKLLSKEVFFKCLYMPRSGKAEDIAENNLFDTKINTALRDFRNPYAKVVMIHIAGYAGCGKTTYIHHLLWEQSDNIESYDVIDYEGCTRAVEPFIERVAYSLGKHKYADIYNYLNLVYNKEIFNMNRFKTSLPKLKDFLEKLKNETEITENKYRILLEEMDEAQINNNAEAKSFLSFLIFLELMLILFDQFAEEKEKKKRPIVLVIDNSDSLHNLAEENILLPIMKDFLNDCNYFLGVNIKNEQEYNGRTVQSICKETNLLVFFTTRIVTKQNYKSLQPDWEEIIGFTSLTLPEHYYNQKEMFFHRIDFYLEQEKNNNSPIIEELKQIRKIAELAYHNYNFMRLFNGNNRKCIERICSIVNNNPPEIIKEIVDLYKERDKNPDAIEGSNGYFLSLILKDFKTEDIYEVKLRLSRCRKDGIISLSRIVLTILREKNDRCSLLELFKLLTPLGFSATDICECIWCLCEVKRQYWRRLIIFDLIIPKDMEDLNKQADLFDKSDFDKEHYSELIICNSGRAYMEYVVPHFEFMLSRHELGTGAYVKGRYSPLFASSSENYYKNKKGQNTYMFEQKIDTVFNDTKDCCYNSKQFSEKVMKAFKIDRGVFIQSTVFNYHTVGWDREVGPKQSYESRLIFRHIGYIEKYRMYLLEKHHYDDQQTKSEINKSLVTRIIKYLKLYQNPNLCFQTESQNKAAAELLEIARKIEKKGFIDFDTRIELL